MDSVQAERFFVDPCCFRFHRRPSRGAGSPSRYPPPYLLFPGGPPALRRRLKETASGREAWKNILAFSNCLRLTYDEKAPYAQPDRVKGDFGGIHGRFNELTLVGGYKHPDYYSQLAAGNNPSARYNSFLNLAPVEGLRCLVEEDRSAAQKLAAATATWVKLEQERRSRTEKSGRQGDPPNPSIGYSSEYLALTYDFIFNAMTDEQKKVVHDELVTVSAWHDNYGTFNNADFTRSNWATFSYWVMPAVAIEGEPGYNDLKVRGLYRGWRNFYSRFILQKRCGLRGRGKVPAGR